MSRLIFFLLQEFIFVRMLVMLVSFLPFSLFPFESPKKCRKSSRVYGRSLKGQGIDSTPQHRFGHSTIYGSRDQAADFGLTLV
jgi:hypothetical protein